MVKVAIDDERVGLVLRATELEQLITSEWQTMSWQIATERQKELLWTRDRIAAIDRAIARRKQRSGVREAK